MENLENIIGYSGISKIEMGSELFPDHKHPERALQRVINGDGQLDSLQIRKLAALIGCKVSDLFDGGWKYKMDQGKIVFEKEGYKAHLYFESQKTVLFRNGSLFYEEVLHSKSIPLSEYISSLDRVIAKEEFDE